MPGHPENPHYRRAERAGGNQGIGRSRAPFGEGKSGTVVIHNPSRKDGNQGGRWHLTGIRACTVYLTVTRRLYTEDEDSDFGLATGSRIIMGRPEPRRTGGAPFRPVCSRPQCASL